ncbi:hypothetical protein VB715_11485 [Crocosphaera sp. UHCC 0190]|uniref:hypothetical protein n=1 Tax=Crocosphaera sp. UHCC 0190 TaxID=3110246 RepID=UPI002B1EB8EC|nr:hypothetical protein [Crocosphaera sp. UHCC 0190]MEA5510387.1 hypothetical protein [Crocosphaera sp. UHCC 0190]
MNNTEQLKTVWQVLESRDRAVFQARQERDRIILKAQQEYDDLAQTSAEAHNKLYDTQLQLADTIQELVEVNRKICFLEGDVKQLREEQEHHIKLIGELRAEVRDLTQQLQLSQAKQESLKQVIEQRDITIEDIKEQLHHSEENRISLLEKIDQLQEKINESEAIIVGMESSKFWQLRERFLRLKKSLGMKAEE